MQRTETAGTLQDTLDEAIDIAAGALRARQNPDGHWRYDLEADATIPAEYVLMVHYLGEDPDPETEQGIGRYLRRIQGAHGGWPLFHEGALDVSATVKAYFALKMIGDPVDAPHMVRAREALLAHGGAESANVFTRILLALYGEVPWRAVPAMPVELMLLPRNAPFSIWRMSYWARTVLVPLLVLIAQKPRARNPRDVHVGELFRQPPDEIRHWSQGEHQSGPWARLFLGADDILHRIEPLLPRGSRGRAIARAQEFVRERSNGLDGLGAIFPAMVNAVLMYDALGRGADDPERSVARTAVEKLLVRNGDETWCQPCVSPVWDTALASHALLEAGDGPSREAAKAGLGWLRPRQETALVGDWSVSGQAAPGGWAFQYNNAHYPDLDDTAVIVMALDRLDDAGQGAPRDASAIQRARDWLLALQSRNGGWAAFDADNTAHYLNQIPFADHGALIDPPTADVTARVVSMLAQLGDDAGGRDPRLQRAIDWLLSQQEEDGSWFGRWGMNYVYGTWSVLSALRAAGMEPSAEPVRRGADWLIATQNPDGGWGEDGSSYAMDHHGHEPAPSTPSQTAWALLGLMAAGRVGDDAVRRGVDYLVERQAADGGWPEQRFNAVGFPRVFYLHYHGYPAYFPLWALARYRNLTRSNGGERVWGM